MLMSHQNRWPVDQTIWSWPADKNIRPFGRLELLKIYLIDSLRWCQSFTLGLSTADHRTIRGRFSFPARRQNMSQVTIWWDARESRPTVDRPEEALLRIWAINSRSCGPRRYRTVRPHAQMLDVELSQPSWHSCKSHDSKYDGSVVYIVMGVEHFRLSDGRASVACRAQDGSWSVYRSTKGQSGDCRLVIARFPAVFADFGWSRPTFIRLSLNDLQTVARRCTQTPNFKSNRQTKGKYIWPL